MIVTPAGTKTLAKKYLEELEEEYHLGTLALEEELSKRIGHKNSVVLNGKVITAYKGEIKEGHMNYWISVSSRIQLDNDDTMPEVKTPFDDIEGDEELENDQSSEESLENIS